MTLVVKKIENLKSYLPRLQKVFMASPNFVLKVTGKLPNSRTASDFLEDTSVNSESDYLTFVVENEGKTIGFIDASKFYPDRNSVYINLLLISEEYQRKGFGTKAYAAFEKEIISLTQSKIIHAGILNSNSEVIPFWKSLGFDDTGIRKPYKDEFIDTELIIMQKIVKSMLI